jgi:hypothetical protein
MKAAVIDLTMKHNSSTIAVRTTSSLPRAWKHGAETKSDGESTISALGSGISLYRWMNGRFPRRIHVETVQVSMQNESHLRENPSTGISKDEVIILIDPTRFTPFHLLRPRPTLINWGCGEW